ncbi:MAG TPA: DsrE family protein [Burkholderiaceae bacterium]|nr:DsrE family protein [Burkholderiaceae bacterium]
MRDAVACAKTGQKVPQGNCSSADMANALASAGAVGLRGTCMDARGIEEAELVPSAVGKCINDLASRTAKADKVLVF